MLKYSDPLQIRTFDHLSRLIDDAGSVRMPDEIWSPGATSGYYKQVWLGKIV